MKIRSPVELNTALSDALAWRKREIITLSLYIKGTKREHEAALLRRSAVLLLYAHFEGFIKQAAEFYLNLVLRQGLPYKRLAPNFIALGAKGAIREAGQSNLLRLHMGVVEFLKYNQGNAAKFDCQDIDTESNLNARVFQNILDTVGVMRDDFFENRMLLIDGSLLGTRNAIAHGEKLDVDEPTYLQLNNLVLELMDYFQTNLQNAASTKAYQRSS